MNLKMGTARPLFLILLVGSVLSACGGKSADAAFAKGNEYFRQNLIPEATIQYKLAIQADPKRGDIRSKLAEAYAKQKDYRSAMREAVIAADLLPRDIQAQIGAGNFLLMAGAFEDAKSRADKALAIDAKNVDAIILMGNALAQLMKGEDAIREFQEAIALNPAADAAYVNIGNIQFSSGRVAEAEASFRRAITEAPQSLTAHTALANFLWASGRQAEAEAQFKEALKIDQADLTANRALGTFYIATGRGAEAEPYFKALAAALDTDEAQLGLADYYLTRGRVEDAKTILTPLLKKTNAFGPASLRVAVIELNQNNRSGAARIVRDVLDKTPKYAEARVLDIRLLLIDNRLDDAMAAANALTRDEPNSSSAAEAYFVIGEIEASRDRTEEAVKAYQDALRIQRQSVATAIALAEIQLKLGNVDKAEAFARQALSTQPRNPNARAVLVRVLLTRNDVTKATAELASLEKEFPNDAPVLNLVAARDLVAGRLDAARATYSKAVAAAPDDLDALQGLIMVDLRSGRKKDAADRIEAALKRIPPSADLYVLAARTHIEAGNLARSEALLKEAIQKEPARLEAYNLLGQLYVVQKRSLAARVQFQEYLKRSPKSVPVSTMIAILFEAEGDLPSAEAQYQKTLSLDPTAAVAANNLAWLYAVSNRNLDQALNLAQTAKRAMPDDPHINDTLGWIFYRKGLFAEAVTYLQQSIRRDATNPAVHYHLGMAYAGAGERSKARQALQKALSMSAVFEGAAEAQKTLDSLGR